MEPTAPATAADAGEAARDDVPVGEEEVYRRFHDQAFLIAYVRTRDREAARDLAQEAMLGVIRGMRDGRLHDPEKLPAYVHGVVRHLSGSYLRTRRRRPEGGPPPEELPAPSGEADVERTQRMLLVRRAIARLRPADRLILLLTLVDGLKPAEIAERLALRPEVVRMRKSRALERAREVLGKVLRT